jgi:sugar diacid utilization regulator
MSWEHNISQGLAERIVNILNEVTGNNVQFMGNGGEIIATTQPYRLGDIHGGAKNVLDGKWDEAALSTEDAEKMEGALPGYTGPITYKGSRIACIGITGDPEEVKPLQQMAGIIVEQELEKEKEKKEKEKMANQIFSDIEHISAKAEELTASSQEISSRSKDTQNMIAKVDESLTKTEATYQTINKIAQKTNILGLNASIEAARLGQEGAGFSVVANEIRELADNSKESIENIDEILNEMRDKMDQILEIANDTSKITEEQAVAIESLTENILEIHELIEIWLKK